MEKYLEKLWNSKCKSDYKKHHFFEKLGVEGGYLIWQCSQCQLCIREKLLFMEWKK